ncbi:MAG: hypothetical protein HY074_16810 [Deltaproteobacteria bacterium]|nr:hypothetical protein [Deltaproteobacteria bacterium]
MKLDHSSLRPILEALDQALATARERRDLVVCGGAALLVLNVTDRQTRDVDVLIPKLDPILIAASERIAAKFGLDPTWLNNGPESLVRDLETGWEERTEITYRGKALSIRVLGRRDLIASKLFAFCDRDENDFEDLIKLKPSVSELDLLRQWVLARDASELWPNRVEKCFKRLKLALANG